LYIFSVFTFHSGLYKTIYELFIKVMKREMTGHMQKRKEIKGDSAKTRLDSGCEDKLQSVLVM